MSVNASAKHSSNFLGSCSCFFWRMFNSPCGTGCSFVADQHTRVTELSIYNLYIIFQGHVARHAFQMSCRRGLLRLDAMWCSQLCHRKWGESFNAKEALRNHELPGPRWKLSWMVPGWQKCQVDHFEAGMCYSMLFDSRALPSSHFIGREWRELWARRAVNFGA